MKSSLLVLALLGVTTAAKAQTSPSTNSTTSGTGAIPAGTISLGGSIGYNRQTDTQNTPGGVQAKVSRSNLRLPQP